MQLKFVHFVLFAKRPSSRPRFSKKSYYIVVLGENDWGISICWEDFGYEDFNCHRNISSLLGYLIEIFKFSFHIIFISKFNPLNRSIVTKNIL